ncbi:SAC3 family protein A isoform X2 [Rutidosis leptorrhynchoides]|uniref:SAC3 family protein A isoform X2 n=1 Tax=Rutidosis leptorrhynchoides TaxID=125765 RepID=UPI003A9A4518
MQVTIAATSNSQINHTPSSRQVNHTRSSRRINRTHSSKRIKHMVNLQELIKVQTSGGYPSANYNNNQTVSTWNQGSYASYGHQYPNYTAESNGAYNNTQNAPAAPQYQPDYKQWTDYYSQTEVTCAPGTENVSSTSASNLVSSVPAVAGGYSAPSSQQLATSTAPSSWRPEAGLSELPSVQPSEPVSNVQEGYWKQSSQSYPNYHVNTVQSNYQKPPDLNPIPGTFQNQHNHELPQQPSVQYSASQVVAHTYQPSLPPPPPLQTAAPFNSGRVNNVQIPTNPRISSNLPKNNNSTIGVTKPAYVSVSLPKPSDNASSHSPADSSLKAGMLPKSLRGYVERALARCKDDKQMAACQDVLKQVITKASTDGTLSTRDWDIEPLFPLPNSAATNNDTLNSSTSPSSLMKSRRSPSRRAKSRWEPLPEEKPVEKQASSTPDSVKYRGPIYNNEKQFSAGKLENNDNRFSNFKFNLSSNKKETNKAGVRPAKRQHIGDGRIGSINDDSSDSDKEQSLTPYYASAITLADTPDERKRRESRSKRFEKNHGNRSAPNFAKNKTLGAGNLYTRRATASALAKSNSLDDGDVSRAVEDIDWDSLTVKGTCQEIEKRYLRLTSAPDPATVRPEEVLEKALLMVQDSQKNYLYKCDQLKSIRQDLTVQRIRNELTAKVYETHARLAIEVGDLSEYNQCQSQLQTLYAEGIKGCDREFSAYNLLCVILHSNNNRDLLSAMSRLSVESRQDAGVKHALAVRSAVTSGNYVLFFRLYRNAPNLNTCLMDLYVEKMRYAAVKSMTRSYRPTIPVSYVAHILGFQSAEPSDENDSGGLVECTEWLKAHGACLAEENSGEMMLDTKASVNTLFMPEPDDAVSHGDASLAVNDFLTRSLS